jgi:SAM-dependent methyltransferase
MGRLDGSKLRCPRCASSMLLEDDGRAACAHGHRFASAAGTPVLLSEETSVFGGAGASSPGVSTGLGRRLPKLSLDDVSIRNYRRLRDELLAAAGSITVLVVGGGDGGAGQRALEHPRINVVMTDVFAGPAIDYVVDAHDLPFGDGTFDAVVAQAVLEHVLDPIRCVSELHRVLKEDGLVYSEVPFMQQVHLGSHDFTRYTLLGHRRLFRQFRELESGAVGGAGSALAWSLTYFVNSFSRSARSRRVLNAAGRAAFFLLRYLDRFTNTEASLDAASAIYFLGRRSTTTLSDEDLLQGYRGGCRP